METLRSNHKIELAREFIVNTRANIFLTGKAGTGKTTMLREVVKSLGKRAVIAAPTGVAALNAGGVTLHSLFQIPFGPYLPGGGEMGGVMRQRMRKNKLSLIRSIELLIIDEVSMVRSDMMDAIDHTLRTLRRSMLPFGGVQLLLIGDLQQLSPICRDEEWELLREHYASPYFFDSKALARAQYVMIEFDEIFRQRDSHFTDILNAVRENKLTNSQLEELNSHYIPNFAPDEKQDYITLTTHNRTANAINSRKLEALKTQKQHYDAKVSGSFSESAYPNDTKLELKVGAQVLFIKNDISPDKRYYNGMIGNIVAMDERSVTVQPKAGGESIKVEAVSWDSIEYNINGESGELEQKINGSFTQVPLKCAWAITIHKSQGLSFDRAIIDAADSFAHGQLYVALSRCRSLNGVVLRTPISRSAVIGESNVDHFCDFVSRNQPSSEILWAYKRDYYSVLLCEIYNFEAMQRLLWDLMSEMSGAMSKSYPKLMASLMELLSTFDKSIVKVGDSFQRQIKTAIYGNDNYAVDPFIGERLQRAAEYFKPRLEPLRSICDTLAEVKSDSKETQRKIVELTQRLEAMLQLLFESLRLCSDGFSVERYQSERARMLALQSLGEEDKSRLKGSKESKGAKDSKGSKSGEKRGANEQSDMVHPQLYETLAVWRREEAAEMKKPAFVVLSNRTLMQIQSELPTTVEALGEIVGMGRVKMRLYSDQILDIVNDYCFTSGIGSGDGYNKKNYKKTLF